MFRDGIWKGASKLCELCARIPQFLGFSPSFTRTKFYQQVLLCCIPWAQLKKGVLLTPASPLSVALYLLGLTEDSLQRDIGCSVLDPALYEVCWAHKVAPHC